MRAGTGNRELAMSWGTWTGRPPASTTRFMTAVPLPGTRRIGDGEGGLACRTTGTAATSTPASGPAICHGATSARSSERSRSLAPTRSISTTMSSYAAACSVCDRIRSRMMRRDPAIPESSRSRTLTLLAMHASTPAPSISMP